MFLSRRQGGALTPQSATPAFLIIFIVIVEKKITVIVIFFSTVVVISIGMHCNALHRDKVKGRKSVGNFRDEQGIGNNSAGGRLPPLRGLGKVACNVVGAASSRPSTYGNVPTDTAG